MRIKDKAKKAIHSGKPVLVDEVVGQLDGCTAASFDIFDTLLKRNLKNPTDVFDFVQKKVEIESFKIKRIEAEQIARRSTNRKEVTLEEIYSYFDGLSD